MMEFGDEPVTIVEIDQPFCQLVYGTSPCQAQLGTTGTKKCYNTRFTCQDPLNYDPADKTLRFSFPQESLLEYGLIIPSLLGVSTSPMRLNLGSMDPDMGAFGERETVVLKFTDHKHSDHDVDKYRTERPNAHGQTAVQGFDPYEQGTFWAKWLVRNPYHEGYAVRIKEGKMGDPLASFRVRNYLIDRIDGPSNGRVTVRCKDLFSLIEARKAQAPVANTGELAAGITAGASSLDLTPTGIGDTEYGTSGHIAIGGEIIEYTRATGSDTMTLVTRGAKNTEAKAHDQEDLVQEVLSYVSERVDDIIIDLLTRFTAITAANIPTSEWAAEADSNLPTLYSADIAKPTPVTELIGELAEQVGFTLWPDVETNQIRLKAIGNNIVPSVTVDDDAWIVLRSLQIRRDPDRRVSRVQVFYGMINPLEELDDDKNFRSQVEVRDVGAEDATQYGNKAIRRVFSRWIGQFGRSVATSLGDLILKLFRDPPFRAIFDEDIQRAGQLTLADPFSLKTRAIVDDLGAQALNTMLPMAVRRGETKIEIEAQKLSLTQPTGQDRIINIDDDVNNVNMRTLHDSLFAPAASGDTVEFIVGPSAIVGSDNAAGPAMQTGDWPTGVNLQLKIDSGGFVAGPGGNGGSNSSRDGKPGGTALKVDFPLLLTNNGVIGGGGGGGALSTSTFFDNGGGGGAGTNNLVNDDQVRGGFGGAGRPSPDFDGEDGSLETGGLTATLQLSGGDLGQPGVDTADGTGGEAGLAIDGDSLVTHLSGSGEIRGPINT
ncbi:MAG: hypothetical protein GWM98_15445 [Nitrospinaceae bacterium]|nr:hypothetical protein [Nitrospinaceae bacterium]NIR55619.1 hypothetical protein [Nitrospinaceae bacterium]NIS86053.1 hypothetical protein [Nitrospinaceae bacterium]NIT82896.1 hypothetical protein [Nitrospinaceae bacterium]NIU45101.1 hypothetical protein [Nitrospinaceae bacterium]